MSIFSLTTLKAVFGIYEQDEFPCPEHNGEHIISRTVGQNDTTFLSVTEHKGRVDVVYGERTKIGWHTESKSGSPENVRPWLDEVSGRRDW